MNKSNEIITEHIAQMTKAVLDAYDSAIKNAKHTTEAFNEENRDASVVRAWAHATSKAAQEAVEAAHELLKAAAQPEMAWQWMVRRAEEALRWARYAQELAAEARMLADRAIEAEHAALRRRVEERERLFDALADVLYAERQYRLAREHADNGFDDSARDLAAEASSKLDEALGVARELVGVYPTDKYATRALDMGLVLRMELDRYTEALEEGEA